MSLTFSDVLIPNTKWPASVNTTGGIAALGSVVLLLTFYALKTLGIVGNKGPPPPKGKFTTPPMEEKKQGRKFGYWKPSNFKAPTPSPYPNWSVEKTKPLPYRPFKHNYFVTMGIRSMEWDDWLELDNHWDHYHDRKVQRLQQENADELYAIDPVAQDAAEELLECMIDYLPNRYPSMFEKTEKGIYNKHTGEDFDTVTRPWTESPIAIAAKLVQDDLAIMIEGKDGHYYLKAGAILLAGFWRLKDKIHLPLREIHTNGDVPKYREKLQTSMEKFFIKLKPEDPVVRNNYFVQTDDDIAWSHAIGPETSDKIGWYTANEVTNPEQLKFRSERQSLRRLPRTGAIVFTIRTYFLPIKDMVNEPYVPGRLYDGVMAWDEDVGSYKGLEKYRDALLPYLQKHHQRQLDEGIITGPEQPNYPF